MSYGELNRRANRLARHLLRLGVGPGEPVALGLERSGEMIGAILAVLKAGGVYVPLDPTYPAERLAFSLADSGARVLLTESSLNLASFRTAGALRTVFLDREQEDWRGESAANLDSAVGADSAAYVIYTSGSTGTPKGVVVRHANVASLLAATRESCAPGAADVWTLFHSYAFDFSVWELWGALAHGGQLVVVPYWVSRSPEAFYELLLRERVTVLNQTPAAFRQLLWAAPASPGSDDLALRLVLFGGEALEPASLAPWFARHGDRRPALVNLYGITETTVHVTWQPLRAVRAVQAADSASLLAASPIGRPLPGWRALLFDRHFEPVPLGVPGEIHVGGAGLTLGYLGRPELTAERFLPDPFGGEPGGRLYRSGDLARRRPDGGLDYLGRLDQQVKIRGFRIELGEIEAALAAHPAVREAVVLAEGEGGDRRLVAYLAGGFGGEGGESAGTGEPPSAAALRAWLGATLPAPMIPSGYVILDALPLTPNGKVDRRALARLAPAPARAGAEGAFVAPRGPVEEILAEIWADLLGVERVGRDDGFFALGGHSLLATQVVSRVRQALGVELPLRQLFEAPTLAGLAAGISSLLPATGAPPLRRLARTGDLPLSFAQERLWFLDQLGGTGEAAYNLPLPVRLSGTLEPALLAAALGEEVRRHEVLRTTFRVAAGRPVQVVAPALPLALPLVDLAELPGARGESAATLLATAEARRPFDLERGPLLRASLLRLAATEHVLLLTLHHIAADGWSLGVLLGEVAALYGALLAGRPSPLPDLAVQYADYALWQRGWLQGEVLAGELRHWRERLAGAPEVLDLPLDRPRPAVHSFHGGHRSVALPAALAEPLAALSRRSGATLFMTLLAVWKALLARHSGQLDIVVGTPIANRTRTEIEGLIGFFVNTLVLRTDLSGRPGFAGLLSRVRETALAAYSHQELPFEKLVAELAPERHLEHTPLFQVMFVLGERPVPPGESPQLPGLRMSGVETQNRSAKFDLTLIAQRGPLGLDLTLGYNSDLFFASTVERLLGQLLALFDGIVAEPERPVAELPLLSAAELHQLLAGWNDTAGEASPDSLHDLFVAQALARPGAVALVSDDALLTYAELDRRAERLAGRLAALGVGPEDRVGIVLERSFELLVAILGVLRAGAAYVPIDPANPRERVLFQLADSKVKVLLSDRRLTGEFAAPLGGEGAPVLCLDEPVRADEAGRKGPAAALRRGGRPGLRHLYLGLDRHPERRRGRPPGGGEPRAAGARAFPGGAGEPGAADRLSRLRRLGAGDLPRPRPGRQPLPGARGGAADPGGARRDPPPPGGDDGGAHPVAPLGPPRAGARRGVRDQRRRRSLPRRAGGPLGERPAPPQLLRPHRGVHLRHGRDRGGQRRRRRSTADRPAGRRSRGLPPRPLPPPGPPRSRRRNRDRRGGGRPRLPGPAGEDRRAFPPRPLERALRGAALSHRGPGPAAARRPARIPRPDRRPGEGPRLPGRAGGDRNGPPQRIRRCWRRRCSPRRTPAGTGGSSPMLPAIPSTCPPIRPVSAISWRSGCPPTWCRPRSIVSTPCR